MPQLVGSYWVALFRAQIGPGPDFLLANLLAKPHGVWLIWEHFDAPSHRHIIEFGISHVWFGVTDALLYKRDFYYLFSKKFSYLLRLSRASEFRVFQYFSTFNTFGTRGREEREENNSNRSADLRRNADHGLFALPIASAPILPRRSSGGSRNS